MAFDLHSTRRENGMLKIRRKANGDVIFALSGRIDQEHVAELEALIVQVALDNPRLGYKKLVGELRKLGCRVGRSPRAATEGPWPTSARHESP
jgi:hypothetical protein